MKIYPCKAQIFILVVFTAVGVLWTQSACNQPVPVPDQTVPPTVPVTEIATLSPTIQTPTLTPVPAAAIVNGEQINLAEYQSELSRLQSAVAAGEAQASQDDSQRVLNELIDQLLLIQGAAEAGNILDQQVLQSRIDRLIQQLGSEAAMNDWMAANFYTLETFRVSLGRAVQAAWMRDQIAAGVPLTVEQVHARAILLYNAEEAALILQRLQSGTDFASVAVEYDPVAGGDLDWFPRGYLFYPELEAAAFSLQAGEYSQAVETPVGFYILQVIERDQQRELLPEARRALQSLAVQTWLAERRQQSSIQILIP